MQPVASEQPSVFTTKSRSIGGHAPTGIDPIVGNAGLRCIWPKPLRVLFINGLLVLV